jgi:hypothetical protein
VPVTCDSTKIKIQLSNSEVITGNFSKGGKCINTYIYSGLTKGTYLLEYYYGRVWLKEIISRCKVNLTIK